MHKAGFVLGWILLAAFPAPAAAQNPASPAETAPQKHDPATAEALFRQGRQSMESKNYQDACQKFGESQKLDPAAGTLMNLATCEEKLGRLASAWQHWKEAIDALPPKDERIPFARSRVEELEKKLPRLQVTLVTGTDQGAKIYRDEIELGPGGQGVPLPVDPGSHAITVRMPGRLPKTVTVSIGIGELSQVDVHPGAVDPFAGAGATSKAHPRTLGWVLGGVGLAGVGTAAVSGLMLIGTRSKVASNCVDKVCNQEGLDAAARGKTLLVVNAASWVVGGLGLGLGTYFLLSAPKAQATTGLVPSVGPGGASLSYAGTF
jgi:hypothetical protein